MSKIGTNFFDIGYMDTLSRVDSPLHRLDPRAKVLTTMAFVVMVVSFGKYEISALIPFFLYPVVLVAVGNLPAGYLLRKVVLVAPFAVLVGIFNPLLDRTTLMVLGPLEISGGWISFVSILVRFVLTVGSALILVACTGIQGVCLALEKLGTPRVLTIELLFLYRYLFVLMDQGLRMVRARALRSFGRSGMGVGVYGYMAGHLLLHTLDRAQRIHVAMSCRGFDGHVRTMSSLKIRPVDIMFVVGWSAFFVGMRAHNIPGLLGRLIMGAFS